MFGLKADSGRRLCVDVAVASDRGLVRRENQDRFFVDPRGALYCVADGMGGGQGGAKASEILCGRMAGAAAGAATFHGLLKAAADAIDSSVVEIRALAASNGWSQTGTTLVALFLDGASRDAGAICHVGDSRAYRLRGGELELLTRDHTVAGEIAASRSEDMARDGDALRGMGRLSHLLTRAIGTAYCSEPEWKKLEMRDGDVYLLCSDGVHDMLEHDALREILASAQTMREAADGISRAVLEAGAIDNFTCVLLKVEGTK